MTLIAIDPGLAKGSYWVSGDNRLITDAGVLPHMQAMTPTHPSDAIVVEVPCLNFGTGGDAVIIDVARAAERCVAWWTARGSLKVTYLHPTGAHAWKQGHKTAHQLHIWNALTPTEKQVLLALAPKGATIEKVETILKRRCLNQTKSEYLFGNAIDAAGLFLYTVGRIDKAGRRLT